MPKEEKIPEKIILKMDIQIIAEGSDERELDDFFYKIDRAVIGILPEAPDRKKVIVRHCKSSLAEFAVEEETIWKIATNYPLRPNNVL